MFRRLENDSRGVNGYEENGVKKQAGFKKNGNRKDEKIVKEWAQRRQESHEKNGHIEDKKDGHREDERDGIEKTRRLSTEKTRRL